MESQTTIFCTVSSYKCRSSTHLAVLLNKALAGRYGLLGFTVYYKHVLNFSNPFKPLLFSAHLPQQTRRHPIAIAGTFVSSTAVFEAASSTTTALPRVGQLCFIAVILHIFLAKRRVYLDPHLPEFVQTSRGPARRYHFSSSNFLVPNTGSFLISSETASDIYEHS